MKMTKSLEKLIEKMVECIRKKKLEEFFRSAEKLMDMSDNMILIGEIPNKDQIWLVKYLFSWELIGSGEKPVRRFIAYYRDGGVLTITVIRDYNACEINVTYKR